MFWNNQNKQKTNRNSSKLVKISTFLIPYTISSVFLLLFWYRSETSKQTETDQKRNFFVSRKSKPKNNRNRLSFGLFRFEPRKKNYGFEYPLIDNVFWGIFLVCFGLFWENSVCFGCFDIGPKHGNKPKQTEKNVFWFRETNRKTTETDWVSVCFGSNRKKYMIVSRKPYYTDINVRGIFPHIWRRAQVQSHIWRKYFSPYMTENSPRFSLKRYDKNFYLRGKFPSNFPYIWRKH